MKLLLKILHKVLPKSNQFARRFVDVISAYVGHCRQYSKVGKSDLNQSKIRVKLDYSSKILDIINISGLLSSREVKSKIPEKYNEFKIEVINKYNKPIGSRICNYNEVLDNLSEDDINDNSPCICERTNMHRNIRVHI